jgi:hypothetical protein
MISTPPINGSTTLSIRASFISSWPTIALNGNEQDERVPTFDWRRFVVFFWFRPEGLMYVTLLAEMKQLGNQNKARG